MEDINGSGHSLQKIPGANLSVRELVRQFNSSRYFNLNDRYDQVDRTDQAAVVSKSVYDYRGTHLLPELLKLRQQENMIGQ
jgi:hypothetical protein